MPTRQAATRRSRKPSTKHLTLEFNETKYIEFTDDPLHHDVSAIAVHGDDLFVACDETASVERLTREGTSTLYRGHEHLRIGDYFDLPDGPDGEMDIEGLAIDDGRLWIIGSHSLKRDKPKRDEHGAAMALDRMLELEGEPNRYFLGCVPLAPDEHGRCGLVREQGGRRAAVVKMRKGRNRLMSWLADDPHLSPFFDIPSKENGFDIEGLAAKGDRVWIGLRGPVLRGFAIVIELSLKTTRGGTLKARRIDGKRRYRKHAIDTAGLGIRDLCFDGTDLLVLVGTPLASDGPAHVIRWRDAAFDTVSGVIDPARLEKVCDLPYRGPVDHPEGIALVDDDRDGPRRLLVAHDSPHPDRLTRKPPRLVLDVLTLDPAPSSRA